MTPVLDEDRERGPDGHLTDAAIAALVDAQPLSQAAIAHADACEACAARIADGALVSLEIQRGLEDLAAAPMPAPPVPARAKQQRPVLYIAAALGIAAIASLPTAGSLPGRATGMAAGAKLQIEGLGQVAHAIGDQAAAPAWSFFLASIFVVIGVAVAVWGSKRERGTKHGFA
jgi:hypothetical protein